MRVLDLGAYSDGVRSFVVLVLTLLAGCPREGAGAVCNDDSDCGDSSQAVCLDGRCSVVGEGEGEGEGDVGEGEGEGDVGEGEGEGDA